MVNSLNRALTLYLASTPEQRRDGAAWYPDALDICQRAADRHGHDTFSVVAAMAILSANTSWNKNVSMTRGLAASRRFRNPGTFQKIARKAWDALRGDITVIRGPKTQAFARAIAGDARAVVVDRHILRALGHWRNGVSPRQYERYAREITQAADIVRVAPAVLQATIWLQEQDAPTDPSQPFYPPF